METKSALVSREFLTKNENTIMEKGVDEKIDEYGRTYYVNRNTGLSGWSFVEVAPRATTERCVVLKNCNSGHVLLQQNLIL